MSVMVVPQASGMHCTRTDASDRVCYVIDLAPFCISNILPSGRPHWIAMLQYDIIVHVRFIDKCNQWNPLCYCVILSSRSLPSSPIQTGMKGASQPPYTRIQCSPKSWRSILGSSRTTVILAAGSSQDVRCPRPKDRTKASSKFAQSRWTKERCVRSARIRDIDSRVDKVR